MRERTEQEDWRIEDDKEVTKWKMREAGNLKKD